MTSDPDRACPHESFEVLAEVNRIVAEHGDPVAIGFIAEIRAKCLGCDEPFRWTGLGAGSSIHRPMCSVDETVLRAPLRPATADPDFGMGIPGFSIGYREHRDSSRG